MSGLVYISLPRAEVTLRSSMHACLQEAARSPAMQSEGLPMGRQALCVLGWSCEQA